MASSLPSTSGTAPAAAPRIPSSSSQHHYHFYPSKVSFRLFSKPKLLFSFSTKGSRIHWNRSAVTRAQLNKVSVDGSSNAAAAPPKPEVPALEEKDATSANELFPVPASEASFSEFMTQVASLVKLVDSRDIVELQLKQLNCELIIRKKEALPWPPPPVFMMQSPSHPASVPSQYPPAQPTPTVAPAGPLPLPPGPTTPPTAKSGKSSLPPLKCPMAGTFYRNPAPSEPTFVKVGDKVNKGQVLCIIEAMKLMNEIEADHSGTILEILVDDGKPVSVDQPLFVIEP